MSISIVVMLTISKSIMSKDLMFKAGKNDSGLPQDRYCCLVQSVSNN